MYLGGPGVPQQLHDPGAGGAPHDAVVTSTTRLPLTVAETGFSLMRTLFSLSDWVGCIKVRPMYLFLMKPMP